MTKILILNPPTKEGIYINRDQMGGMGQRLSFGKSLLTSFLGKMKSSFIRQPVFQLVYAATILSESNDVLVIDSLNENLSLNDIIKKAIKFCPEYTIMAVSSSDILYERDVVAKKIKECTKSKIITIGDTITNSPSLFKEPFDISITGEVEGVVKDIIDKKKLSRISGIIYIEKGKAKTNKRKELLNEEELEKIKFPKWEIFPYKKYRYYPLLYNEPAVSMLSSRGCPYACYYCSYSKNEGEKLRMRNAKNVVDEIENNIKKYGINGIVFRDPLFTGNRKRTKEVCRLIIKKNLNIGWACETRPELLDEEILKEMRNAGCRAINMGIESINEKELNSVGRNKVDLNKLKKIIECCNKLGIRTTGFFILGLPESTKESMNKTIEFSLNSGLNHAEYKIATPYPGTKLREIAIKNNWLKNNNIKNLGGYDAVMCINKEISPEYIDNLCNNSFKKFYYRFSWIWQELRMGDNLKKANFFVKTIFRVMTGK
ncbi:MAG: radical SAM protein [Nanoarchaeota archaeon]|nr:radical SAM protein [Nanoarchaeota archaeon]